MTMKGESKRNPVMLSTFAMLSVNSAKHLEAHADRPFAAAQGDTVRQLRLTRTGADKSALGTINRPLRLLTTICYIRSLTRIEQVWHYLLYLG